jgi:AcrR family transcriptional regulator
MTESPRRRYAGQSFADRDSDRRERLIRAGLEVYASTGAARASVSAICAEAGLTTRYFYELFGSREGFFTAAFRAAKDHMLNAMRDAIDPSNPTRSALTGLFQTLLDNPSAARVFLLELNPYEPAALAVGTEGAEGLAALFLPAGASPLVKAGLVGAVIQLARHWIAQGYTEPLHDVVEAAQAFVARAATAKL